MCLAPSLFTPAQAQTLVPQAASNPSATNPLLRPSAPADGQAEQILVTGSRLRTSNATSQDPVTVIDSKQIAQTSAQTLQDVLSRLPNAGTGGVYGTDVNGGEGLSCASFRNLGLSRVLVLVDGKRIVHTGNSGTDCVDLDNIAVPMVDRIEILKDGASSIYGADAVSGVINIILKRNYSGTQVNVGGRITGQGDAREADLSVVHGFDFDQGRGNFTLSGTYQTRGGVGVDDRDWAHPGSYSNLPGVAPTFGSASPPGGRYVDSPNNTDQFVPGDRGQIALGNGRFQDWTQANAYDANAGHMLLLDSLENENVSLNTHYDLLPHVTAYLNGFYDHKQTLQELSEQAVTGGYSSGLPADFIIPGGNPYNPFGADVAGYRSLSEFGGRIYRSFSDTFQLNGGLRGDFAGNWHYDVGYSYGKSEDTERSYNQVDYGRLEQEVGFRSVNDPNATVPSDSGVYDPGVCTSRPGCVLINPFGPNSISPAGVDYARFTSQYATQFELRQVAASINNNKLFSLPYGPVGLALGVEHRGEQGSYHPDPRVVSGTTLENPTLPTSGGFNVTEVYGELHVPLLANLPAIKDLSANLSGRFSDYDTFGSAETWKAGLNYTPVADIRFRANIGTSFRQPSINELYAGQTFSFNNQTDPCTQASTYGGAAGIVAANCARQGLRPNFQADGTNVPTIQGGNPALQPETSRTYSIGTVITPRWIKHLSATIDYWHTSIENSIGAVDSQTIVDTCYTSANLSNPLCSQIAQRSGTGQLTSLTAINQNLGVTRTDGLDFTLSYLIKLGGGTSLRIGNEFDKVFSFQQQNVPDGPFVQYAGTEDFPRIRDNATATISHDAFSFSYTMRYIDGTNFFPVSSYQPGQVRSYRYPDVFYHDLVATYGWRGITLIGGIDNVTDRDPPFHPGFRVNADFDQYDVLGRLFYLKTQFKF